MTNLAALNPLPLARGAAKPANDERGAALLTGDDWRVLRQRETGKADALLLSVNVAPRKRKRARLPTTFEGMTAKEQRKFASEAAAELRRQHEASVVPAGPAPEVITFHQFGESWARGDLAKLHPGHVREKTTAADDVQRLRVIREIIGDVPLRGFGVEHAEKVLRNLPARCRSESTTRQYAQVIHRVLALAVYPGKLLERNPLPPGFLPKMAAAKAKSFLYPEDDAALLSCAAIPLGRRFLYGFLSREGMRLSEALGLRWKDLDLTRGAVALDENKTNDPRSWALGSDVVRALVRWREQRKAEAETALVFGGTEENYSHRAALILRADLQRAAVTRAQLFEKTATRQPVRVHDLRGTFVTLALAIGKSEAWVTDRTGHRSSTMVAVYKRTARTAGELGLGWLQSLDALLFASPGPTPPAPEGPPASKRGTDDAPELPQSVATPPTAPSSAFHSVHVEDRETNDLASLSGTLMHTEERRPVSKSAILTGVWVQVPPSAQD